MNRRKSTKIDNIDKNGQKSTKFEEIRQKSPNCTKSTKIDEIYKNRQISNLSGHNAEKNRQNRQEFFCVPF